MAGINDLALILGNEILGNEKDASEVGGRGSGRCVELGKITGSAGEL